MNIVYANTLLLPKILGKIKIQQISRNGLIKIFASPFHTETHAILEVKVRDNVWKDTLTQRQGNVMDFVAFYLERQNRPSAQAHCLHWLKFNIGYPSLSSLVELPDYENLDKALTYDYRSDLLNCSLGRFLSVKNIPLSLANKFLFEIGVTNKNTGKKFVALGLQTEEGGYAICNQYIRAIVGNRSISYIRGLQRKFEYVHIFKDIFDYLAVVRLLGDKPLFDECIILNSYSCLDSVAAYIRGFGYKRLYSWMDNCKLGGQVSSALDFLCRTEQNLTHIPMNDVYKGFNGVAEKYESTIQ